MASATTPTAAPGTLTPDQERALLAAVKGAAQAAETGRANGYEIAQGYAVLIDYTGATGPRSKFITTTRDALRHLSDAGKVDFMEGDANTPPTYAPAKKGGKKKATPAAVETAPEAAPVASEPASVPPMPETEEARQAERERIAAETPAQEPAETFAPQPSPDDSVAVKLAHALVEEFGGEVHPQIEEGMDGGLTIDHSGDMTRLGSFVYGWMQKHAPGVEYDVNVPRGAAKPAAAPASAPEASAPPEGPSGTQEPSAAPTSGEGFAVLEETVTEKPKRTRGKKAEPVAVETVGAEPPAFDPEVEDDPAKVAERIKNVTGRDPATGAEVEGKGSKPKSAPVDERYALDLKKPDALAKVGKTNREKLDKEARDSLDQIMEKAAKIIAELPDKLKPEEAIKLAMYHDAREALFSDGALTERFTLGVIARRVSDSAKYGDAAIKGLAEATGIHPNTLRECRRLAATFKDNITLFVRWLRSMRHVLSGRPARWYHVQDLIGTWSDVSVLGPDELAEALTRQVEKVGQRVEEAAGHAKPEGVAIVLTDAAATLREEGLTALAVAGVQMEETPVHHIPRDPGFLRFVSKLACAATGEMPPEGGWDSDLMRVGVDPHHVGTGGAALKGSDYTAVPLAREPHNVYHTEGPKAFRKKYGVDLRTIMFQTLHLYLAGVQADLPSSLDS